jgi:hypothetical protein
MKHILLILTFVLVSATAHATTWCLISDFNSQCWYYSLSACQQAAAFSGGACLPLEEGDEYE